MPGRRVHLICTYKYSRSTGARLPDGAAEALNTLIDHPGRARKMLEAAARKLCSDASWGCGALRAVVDGLRVPGVATHDWAKPKGAILLKRVASALFGEGVGWIIDLHYALDCLEQGGPICSLAPEYAVEWARENCLGLLGKQPT